MEVLLNLVWVASAIALTAAWLRTAGRTGNRCKQFIAVAVLIATLFPVISVSDDLLAVQFPGETDTCARRSHIAPSEAHPLLPAVGMVPPPVFAGFPLGFLQYVSPAWETEPPSTTPSLASIQNRPPPEA